MRKIVTPVTQSGFGGDEEGMIAEFRRETALEHAAATEVAEKSTDHCAADFVSHSCDTQFSTAKYVILGLSRFAASRAATGSASHDAVHEPGETFSTDSLRMARETDDPAPSPPLQTLLRTGP